MGSFKNPRTFLIGETKIDWQGLTDYLEYTNQLAFEADVTLSDAENLVSFYAKLCYKSLVEGKNDNLTRIRGIADNLKGVIKSKHGSVFEHFWISFVTTDCSRVFTHELVRHRAGTAFSQTSGRFVALDEHD